jgi:hypothetical protein
MLKWKNANLKISSTILMKNISPGINVTRKNSLWPFHKTFWRITLKFTSEELLPLLVEDIRPSDQPDVEPQIALHALIFILAPQTLKLIGYVKHHKFIILIDSSIPANFNYQWVDRETDYHIDVVNNFQVMIANGGSMKCGGPCENVWLQMDDYSLKTHMFDIEMGGCDIVLGVEWLRTLGLITMDFWELYMIF